MFEMWVAIMSVFAVWGIINVLSELCKALLRVNKYDRIVIYVKSDTSRIEGVVRALMIKNPTAEIVVLDESEKDELRRVVDKLCRDNPCVHIGKLE